MKKLALVASILIAGSVHGFAADMAPRYSKAPVAPVETWNWGGFYIGGNVGGAWERGSSSTNFISLGTTPLADATNPQSNSLNSSALIGGIHGGYNWQAAAWVFGLEADWDWTNTKNGFCRQTDAFSLSCADNNRGFLTLNEKTEWLGSARGRVGYAWDRFMIYGTGGAAWGKIDTSINANCLVGGCGFSSLPLNGTANFSTTKTGWVAGAGIEAMLTANWIVRAEYLHYDLGSINYTAIFPASAGPGTQSATWSRSFQYETVRAGLSYKFGGPVVARY
jgi:outer membrane immunogenic protein